MVNLIPLKEPAQSSVGGKARERIIEAAGEVFAEKGLQGATSREICQRAEVNLAAVNYHFGGFEALYVATLIEAHRRAEIFEPLTWAGPDDRQPEDKLRAIIRAMVERVSQSSDQSWEMRLVSRELVIPTFAHAEFVAASIEPRRALLKSLIGEIIGRPADDPIVARCLFTVISPCIMLSIVNRPTLLSMLPDIGPNSDGVAALVDHVERFVFAGLYATAKI